MKARDMMIPLQEYLRPEDTIKYAVNLFKTAHRDAKKLGVKGLPVINEVGKLEGMLSMRDIIKAISPTYTSLQRQSTLQWQEIIEVGAAKVSEKKVVMYMMRDILSLREDATILECIDYMVKKNINRVPVTDKTGKVVGMLYERDLFFEIVKIMIDEDGAQ